MDEKFTFWMQICRAADKESAVVAMLSRLMPNIACPRSSKRRALMSLDNSIMLYGAEVLADALKKENAGISWQQSKGKGPSELAAHIELF